MKTRSIFFSLLFSFIFISLTNAQKFYDRSGKNDNWFIHVGAGVQTFLPDPDLKTDFRKKMSLMPALSIGKEFSPYWGARIKGEGGLLRESENGVILKNNDKYYSIHMDALWNLSNQLGGYSSTRFFNFVPYLGLGFAHHLSSENRTNITNNSLNAISINGGLQLGFQLSKRIRFDFDLGTAVLPNYFYRTTLKTDNEMILSATGGLTFQLGKITFDVIEPMDRELINELNKQINTIHAQNKELSGQLKNRPANCPEQPQCPQVVPEVSALSEVNYIPNVVFFRVNSAKVDNNQQISIFNMAEYMIDTGKKIKVTGYADKDTGTSSYNMKLSEKRAKAVAGELITKYKVPSQNIVVEWKGAEEQPYKQNNWNRVVIMNSQQ
jgi:outer membrane protein OmpA-like peptidoglycan-associated protein